MLVRNYTVKFINTVASAIFICLTIDVERYIKRNIIMPANREKSKDGEVSRFSKNYS